MGNAESASQQACALQIELIAKLRYLGVYLYPCMPNTTVVMQETDWMTYGKIKTAFWTNLELLMDECVLLEKSVAIPQYKHELLVFGGVDPDTGLELVSAYELGFLRQCCLDAWETIGAAPLTCKSLDDPQVRWS